MNTQLTLDMLAQPDDNTCGPTCLQAVYRYYEDDVALNQLIGEVPSLEGGGTLGVMLANHALSRGYQAQIYTYNLMIFDPTWFRPGVVLKEKLQQRSGVVTDAKQCIAIQEYIGFLEQGGRLCLEDLTRSVLRRFLTAGQPILTGLNSTFLYRTPRVYGEAMVDDDIRGEVVGHFVVLCGYDRPNKTIRVADPYSDNPYSKEHYYDVPIDRVMGAIMLGVMTHDANFLIIHPTTRRKDSIA
jgi:hypothetical protein